MSEIALVLLQGFQVLFLLPIAAWSPGRTGLPRIGRGSRAGCHLHRKIDELITAAGFQITELKTFYLPGPRPMTYTYQSFAQLPQPGEDSRS